MFQPGCLCVTLMIAGTVTVVLHLFGVLQVPKASARPRYCAGSPWCEAGQFNREALRPSTVGSGRCVAVWKIARQPTP